jgi:hypothetical protein
VSNDLFIGILMALVVIGVSAGAMAAYVFRMRRTRIVTSPAASPPATADADVAADRSGARRIAGGPNRKAAFRMMAQWYAGKRCAICEREIAPLSHFGPEPGLMSATSPPATVAWTDVIPEQLPNMLDTHLPVCSSCHLVNWFQHEHPDLVIDRHRTQETDTILH